MGDRPTISLVVPCYNEEESLPQLKEVLLRLIPAFERTREVEILLVDDGSTDGTRAALERLAPEIRGRVLKHERNRGIAEAYRTGYREARGDIICTIDADCTFDPMELIPMLDKLLESGAGLVVASPYHPRGRVEGVPGWRLVLSRGASGIYRLLLPVKLYSYTPCFRVMRREAVERFEFEDPGFLGISQMLVSAILQGVEVVEWPITLRSRVTGVSKMRSLSVMRDHLRFMSRLLLLRMGRLFRGA